MKKAFTLVELLVVIGIIAILAGVLLVNSSKSTESARMVKCAANMRNLAMAARSVHAAAQSYQYAVMNMDVRQRGIRYTVRKGWLSYLDRDATYPMKSPGSFSQPSFAGTEEEKLHALTNGAIWKTIGSNRDCYRCPAFVKLCERKGARNPGWSYQMSAYFGYEPKSGAATAQPDVWETQLTRADRILLFAEIQALEKSDIKSGVQNASELQLPTVKLDGASGDTEMDGCLCYTSKGGNESIGFNHCRNGQVVGHVAFADGHVETFAAPQNGNFNELTDWLCCGKDVVYQSGTYQEVKNSDVD